MCAFVVSFVDMDAPAHTQQRGLVEPSFDLAAVRTPAMRSLIQTEIDAALKNLKQKGDKGAVVDFNTEFAQPVVTNIMSATNNDNNTGGFRGDVRVCAPLPDS
jgi:cytochrome P450